jgi:hypothetical protein
MILAAEITFGSNFFIGGKSAELNPFSTVSQVIITSVTFVWPLSFAPHYQAGLAWRF